MKNLREFQLEVNVNASKVEVWDLLFNKFGEVNLFNPEIEGSHHTTGVKGEVGCERQCDINSKCWAIELSMTMRPLLAAHI